MKHTLIYLALAAVIPGSACAAETFSQDQYAQAISGDIAAQVQLGKSLIASTSARDQADGVEWLGNAAKASNGEALTILAKHAISHDDAQGYTTAKGYLKEAVEVGEPGAKQLLANMRELPALPVEVEKPRLAFAAPITTRTLPDITMDLGPMPSVEIAQVEVTPAPVCVPASAPVAPAAAIATAPATTSEQAAQVIPYDSSRAAPLTPNTAQSMARKANLQGLASYARGNYKEAAQLFARAVDLGSVAATANLGVMYLKGRGISRNVAQAVNYLRYAADRGNLVAARNLSMIANVRS